MTAVLRLPCLRRMLWLVGLVWLSLPPSAHAQLQVSMIHGVVRDAQQQPVADALVTLLDSRGTSIRSATSAADGTFRLSDVAPGGYVIRVQLRDALLLERSIVVRGSLPVEMTLEIGPAMHEEVVVRGDAGSNTAEHPWSVAGDAVRRTIASTPGQQVQNALATLPGWMAEDNGLLHVRGVDDGLLYVQDGIPVYERLDRVFGMPPNPSAIASMEVLNGYIPPEFGFKSGGVIQVRSETGRGGPWSGSIGAGAADLSTRNVDALAAGPLGSTAGVMFTASHETSSRFLDPVDPGNLHNTGAASSGGAQLTWQRAGHLITATAQAGRDHYDVPHSVAQEIAGQDQRERTAQLLFSGTWQQVLSERTVWQISAYRRSADASLLNSPEDTPVTANGRRRDTRQGALWSLTNQRGRHTLKAGGELSAVKLDEQFSFAVTDPGAAEDAGLSPQAIAHDSAHPFVFSDRRTPTLWSGFAQDAFQATSGATINFGVRVDRSRMLIAASQWSPRLGASVRLREGLTLRASVMRLFQPPQAEYLLLGSSVQARALSPVSESATGGGASIPPERQTAMDVSLAAALPRGWHVEGAVWRRRVQDVDDPNVFFGTTVFVPNSVGQQHAWGIDVRVDTPVRHGWSASANYSRARVVQFAPVTGGLFLEDDLLTLAPGEEFTPDHDQRHALFATTSYQDETRGWRVSAAFKYRSGTPVGVDPSNADEVADRHGSEVVDFTTGRVKPRRSSTRRPSGSCVRAIPSVCHSRCGPRT